MKFHHIDPAPMDGVRAKGSEASKLSIYMARKMLLNSVLSNWEVGVFVCR